MTYTVSSGTLNPTQQQQQIAGGRVFQVNGPETANCMTQRAPDRATTSYFAGENVDLEILPSKGDQADIVFGVQSGFIIVSCAHKIRIVCVQQ